MSGYDSIVTWSDKYIPMSKYIDFLDWVTVMEKHFEKNMRSPIGEIFDSNDWRNAEERFNQIHQGVKPVEQNIIESFDIEKTLGDLIKNIPVFNKPEVILEQNYTVEQLKKFFKKVFDL